MHGIVGQDSITIIANICIQASYCVIALHKYLVIMYVVYVIYVAWAGMIRLMCTHEAEGVQCLRVSVDISGKS